MGWADRARATASMTIVACVAGGLVVGGAEGRARAWDDFGHMQVAAVAYANLTPAARARATQLLKRNPRYSTWIIGARTKAERDQQAFVRAATWADAIKSDRAYKDDLQTAPTAAQNLGYGDLLRHKYWHFVDQPLSADGTAGVPTAAPNVATQVPVFRATLSTAGGDDDVKSYDLVWLLHLVGDAHQPLHCVSRFDAAEPLGDQGGNKVLITGNAPPPICDDPRFCPFGPPSDLHAFFDDITGSTSCVGEVEATATALPKPGVRQASVLDVSVWIEEGLTAAKTVVYVAPIGVGPGPFAVDATYQKAATALGKQRIGLAGARLARLLNDCFAKEASGGPTPKTSVTTPAPPPP